MAGLQRLQKRADFLRVAGVRRKFVTPGLILQAARQTGEPAAADISGPAPSRVGFTATRKIGIAVARNRARRRLRSAADQVLPLHAAPGHDYVVVARAESLTRPYSALIEDLATALRRLGVYRDTQTGDAQPAGDVPRQRSGGQG
jgi:ribonuclease P protein component